ncbi:MAG TPA: universal stress protein [Puia sp.]|nr:universal stress protein [Puia sp.]
MKTILIPLDFTTTSDNALEFAQAWSRNFEYDHIILLKTFYSSFYENVLLTTEYVNVSQEHRKNDMEMLRQWRQEFIDKSSPGVKVSIAVSEKPLLRSIIEIVESEQADLIVLGSDHYNHFNNSFISSQTIEIAKASPVTVLIVPSISRFKAIQKLLVPIDIQATGLLERLERFRKKSPWWADKELMILHVDPKEKSPLRDEAFERNENSLHEFLKDFHHKVYYSNNTSILNGINNFLNEHPADLVVALPGRHSFLYSLTHKSISEAIYQYPLKPVLILK